MRPIRTYLLVYSESGWESSVHRDFESLYETWMKFYDSKTSTGVIHVGITRPDNDAFSEYLTLYKGRMILTASARWALLSESECAPVSIGKAEGIPLYIALNRWGYEATLEELGLGVGKSAVTVAEITVKENSVLQLSIDELNLPVRASNCLVSAGILLIGDLLKYSELELRRLPNCGEKTFNDINESLAVFNLHPFHPDFEPRPLNEYLINHHPQKTLITIEENCDEMVKIYQSHPDWLNSVSISELNLHVRTFRALTSVGVNNISDLKDYDSMKLLNIPNFGRTSLNDLINQLRLAIDRGSNAIDFNSRFKDEDDSSPNNFLNSPIKLASEFKDKSCLATLINSVISSLPENLEKVMTARMGMPPLEPMTLQEVGEKVGVTRERVRQLEAKAMLRIGRDSIWTDLLESKISNILEDRTDPLPINGLAILDTWFFGVEELVEPFKYLLKQKYILDGRFSIFDVNGQLVLSKLTPDEWNSARRLAMKLLEDSIDKKINLSEARHLVEELLGSKGRELRSELWASAKIFAHFSTSDIDSEPVLVSFGRGAEALVEAVLSESDRPLHYSEIRDRIENRFGKNIDIRRSHSAADGVGLLYGRGSYGLMKHCPLTSQEIELVRQEVIDEISNKFSGRQWSSGELLGILHEREVDFGDRLNIFILNIILKDQNEIKYLGRNTYQSSGVDSNRTRRIDIRQAVISLLTQEGKPMTNKEIKEALTKDRGISDSFQIHPTGPLISLGVGLWGLIDRDLPINTEQQEEMRLVMYAILEKRQKGIHVTEIEDFLKTNYPPALAVKDPAGIFSIAVRDNKFSKTYEDFLYLTEWGEPRRIGKLQALQEVLSKCGDYGLTMNEIIDRASILMERDIPRNGLSRVLNEVGAKFDENAKCWKVVDEFHGIEE